MSKEPNICLIQARKNLLISSFILFLILSIFYANH